MFPLKRCKDPHLAGTAGHTVSLCCCGDTATSRALQVLAQHAPILLVFEATHLPDPGGRSSGTGRGNEPCYWFVICQQSSVAPSQRRSKHHSHFYHPTQHRLDCGNASYLSCISLCAKLTKLLMEASESTPQTFGHLLLFHNC